MNLEIAILGELDLIHPLMEREGVLLAAVKNASVRVPTNLDIERALGRLERKCHVVGVSNEDTGTRWKITDAGIARLAEYNS